MNKESAFSPEYDISDSTESKTSMQDSMAEDKEADGIIKKIESDYKLSKPRRNIIRARIIKE